MTHCEGLMLIPSEIECQLMLPTSAKICSLAGLKAWQVGDWLWAVSGIGATASGITTSLLLDHAKPQQAWLMGIAGAFRQSDLDLTEVVQINHDVFADLGYETQQSLVGLDEMGLPLLTTTDTDPISARFTVEVFDSESPSVAAITVNRITASEQRALQLHQQFGAGVEQMEGAGVALACRLASIPFHHVRGISNLVGPRDPASWQIASACQNLCDWLKERSIGGL